MKILFLAARFYPEVGGVEKHVLEISKELLNRGHKINIVTELRADYQHNKKSIYQSRGKSDIRSQISKEPVKSIQTLISEFEGIEILRMNFGKSNWLKKFRIWGQLI